MQRISFKIVAPQATRPGRRPQIQKSAHSSHIGNDHHTFIPISSATRTPLGYSPRLEAGTEPSISVAVISAPASPARQPRISTSIDEPYVHSRHQSLSLERLCTARLDFGLYNIDPLKTSNHLEITTPTFATNSYQHTTMDAPTIELMSALASYVHSSRSKTPAKCPSMFESGKYSDLTIVCGNKSYPVHRALLASRSSFFDGACRNAFKESSTGIIDLSEDDPEAVEHMVHCKQRRIPMHNTALTVPVPDFYHLDYLNRSLSRRSSRRSSGHTSSRSPHFAARRTPKKLNLALIEDPLLAMAAAVDTSMPLTPPAEQDNQFDSLNAFTKLPDSPIADQFDECPFDSMTAEPDANSEKPHLITHAKVYAIAEK